MFAIAISYVSESAKASKLRTSMVEGSLATSDIHKMHFNSLLDYTGIGFLTFASKYPGAQAIRSPV